MELIGNVEALVILYAPIVITYAMQIIGFIQSARKLKKLNVKEDVTNIIKPLKSEINSLNMKLLEAHTHTRELEVILNTTIQDNVDLKRNYEALTNSIDNRLIEQNELLNNLVKKNVEWEAKARVEMKKNEVQYECNNPEV